MGQGFAIVLAHVGALQSLRSLRRRLTRALGHLMHLYLKLNGTLAEAADLITSAALPTYERQLRDGLNLGGGEYFKFSDATSEVLFGMQRFRAHGSLCRGTSKFPLLLLCLAR